MSAAAEGHQRRSSLSEALEMHHGHPEQHFTINVPERQASEDMDLRPESSFLQGNTSHDSSQMDSADTNVAANFMADLSISTRKSGVAEVEQSPFTPDFPAYELYTEAGPQLSTRKSSVSSGPSTLGTVPEDSPAAPEHSGVPAIDAAGFLSPDKMKLKQVKTPRKSLEFSDSNPFARDPSTQMSADDPDRAQRQQPQSARSDTGSVLSCVFKQPSMTFNPFEMDQDSLSPEETRSRSRSLDDDFFAMDFSSQKSRGEPDPAIEIPDDSYASIERQERGQLSPRETLGQLMSAVEAMIDEVEAGQAASQARTIKTTERDESIAKLQSELDVLRGEEADMDARLRVIHSQLEANLLSNLEQEDDIRVSGETLRSVKDEINDLDIALSAAEEQRRDLERQLADSRASKLPPSQENVEGHLETEEHNSGKSNYSSAWETSESETETYVDTEPRNHRRTLSEDNQAKMSQQGAKGGSWLREILRNRNRKDELPPPIAAEEEDTSTPKGGGMSHFQLPATAAELEKTASEEISGVPLLPALISSAKGS